MVSCGLKSRICPSGSSFGHLLCRRGVINKFGQFYAYCLINFYIVEMILYAPDPVLDSSPEPRKMRFCFRDTHILDPAGRSIRKLDRKIISKIFFAFFFPVNRSCKLLYYV